MRRSILICIVDFILGFIHMLVPAMENLTNPCLGPAWSEDYRAFAPLFAIIAIILMQLLQFMIGSTYEKKLKAKTAHGHFEPQQNEVHMETELMHLIRSNEKRSAIALLELGVGKNEFYLLRDPGDTSWTLSYSFNHHRYCIGCYGWLRICTALDCDHVPSVV